MAARMGAQGRKRAVESFGWQTIADRTIALYERVSRVR